jgi:hypothetical protein
VRGEPIDFGIIHYGTSFDDWMARAIDDLLALDYVRLRVLIVPDGVPHPSSLTALLKNLRRDRLLFEVYERFLLRPAARCPVELGDRLRSVPLLACRFERFDRYAHAPAPEHLQAIADYHLDFILHLAGEIILRGDLLRLPRFGVWSFHHDDEQEYRGGPPGFWEVYRGDARTGAMLQRLTERLDAGVPLRKSHTETRLQSYAANIDGAYYMSAPWPAQVCADLHDGCGQYLDGPPSSTTAGLFRPPSNGQTLAFGLKVLARRLTGTLRDRRRGGPL